MNRLLCIVAAAEGATGLALLLAPSRVVQLLLGAEFSGVAIPLARLAGIALIAPGINGLPGRARIGLLVYNVSATVGVLCCGRRLWFTPCLRRCWLGKHAE